MNARMKVRSGWRIPARFGTRRRVAAATTAVAVLALPLCARAQLESVPRMGIANDWVQRIHIELDSQWEWVETAPDRVYFATRLGAQRQGDVVSMWMRVEYRDPEPPDQRLSAAERSEWDCAHRRRAVREMVVHRWNNLDDTDPDQAKVEGRVWEDIKPKTAGESLLNFACAIPAEALKSGAAEPATDRVRVPTNATTRAGP